MIVLVVEDDPLSLKLSCLVLEHGGFSVTAVPDAESAMRSISMERPDLILLDLSLPGMDGLELARLLKANVQTAIIPVIAVTAFPDRFSREQAETVGCDGYVIKPLPTRELTAKVKDAIRKKQ